MQAVDFRQGINPSQTFPKEVHKDGFLNYAKGMDAHLQGKRGASLFWLLFSNSRENFNEQGVGLGLTPACPLSLRQQIMTQFRYRANETRHLEKKAPFTTRSIRVTNLMAATLGMVLSLTYRVVRVVLRTLLLPVSFLYALDQQRRYKIDKWGKEDLKRIGWEWIDLCVVVLSSITGIINTISPNAVKLDGLRNYYDRRISNAIQRNQEFAQKKKEYLDQLKQADEN